MFYVVEGELTLSCNLKGYFHILPKIQKSYLKNKINKTNEGKMTKNNNFNPPPHTHIHTDTNTWVGGWAGMGGCWESLIKTEALFCLKKIQVNKIWKCVCYCFCVNPSNLESGRSCKGKHKGHCNSKLGVKCCYRNLSFLQSNFFHVNSVLLWQYSILMPSSFFISCDLSALKSESSSDCVFHMFNC